MSISLRRPAHGRFRIPARRGVHSPASMEPGAIAVRSSSPVQLRALAIARRELADMGLDDLAIVDTSSRKALAVRRKVLSPILLRLRLAGVSYPDAARACRVSEATARRLVAQALQWAENETLAEAQHLRTMELRRLDLWEEALQTKIEAGNPEAIDKALAIQARRLALQGNAIGRSGVMQSPLGTNAGPPMAGDPSGVQALSYVELRTGMVLPAEGLESMRALVAGALAAGAVRLPPQGETQTKSVGPQPPSPQPTEHSPQAEPTALTPILQGAE